MKFPKTICVRSEAQMNGPDYLAVIGTPDKPNELDSDDGTPVAIYQLVHVDQMSVVRSLVPKRK